MRPSQIKMSLSGGKLQQERRHEQTFKAEVIC